MAGGKGLDFIFRALGDSVRLEMVRRLAEGRPSTISTVSAGLGVTRQGARKHLQVLVDADLVALLEKGRETLVQFKPSTLDGASALLQELGRRWDDRLEALRRFLEEGQTE